MVVDELDIVLTSLSPDEAETPLFVDADAVLPASITDQTLQAGLGGPEHPLPHGSTKLPQGGPLTRPVDTLDVLLNPDVFGALVPE